MHDKIMIAIIDDNGGLFFIYSYSGTGKTFVKYLKLCTTLQFKGDIVQGYSAPYGIKWDCFSLISWW